MDVVIITIMLVCSGLFTGGVVTFTWNRLPAWKNMDIQSFKTDFRQTIKITDRLQPILLVGTILTAGIWSMETSGIAQIFVILATGGFSIVLLASILVLVPLQNRILNTQDATANIKAMYAKWHQGHIGRTILSLASLLLLAVSVSMLVGS